MSGELRKLLVIVTESSLERNLVRDFMEWGVTGYTITDARGKGSRGIRDAGWDVSANIRIEIICNLDVARRVMTQIRQKYYANYAMVSYLTDVEVLRSEKF